MSTVSVDSPESKESTQPEKATVGVLLLHGLTGMPDEMRPVMRHLKKLGFRVEVPMLPGHGATHVELLNVGWKDWYKCALDALRELKKECPTVVVGGLSMGAIISALLSLDEEVDGVVLLSPTMVYDLQGPKILCYNWARQIARHILQFRVFGDRIYWTEAPPYGLRDQRLQKQITKAIEAAQSGQSNAFGLFRTYWGSLYQLFLLVEEFRKNAKRMKCPALLIHSYEDTITSVDNPTEAYNLVGSKDKSLLLLTGCDHVLTLDLCKDQVASHFGRFTQRVAKVASEKVAE
jgi:carboxylesterase